MTLLLVELLAVTWVPCKLRHPVCIQRDSETGRQAGRQTDKQRQRKKVNKNSMYIHRN